MMIRTLFAASAATLLFALPVAAQSGKSDTPPAPAEKMAPAMNKDTGMSTTRDKDSDRTTAAKGQWRASKVMGSAVYSTNNESIGDINELLVDGDGRIAQVVIGVGGFLGMGERNVAVPFEQLTLGRKDDAIRISGDFTKKSLKSMEAWDASKWQATKAAAGNVK